MTITSTSQATAIVAQAREIAARGTMSYHEALDVTARDQGYSSWQGVLAISSRGQETHPGGTTAALHDIMSTVALLIGANTYERRRDRYLTSALRPIWKLLQRVPGLSPAVLAKAALLCAVGANVVWITLSIVLMNVWHPLDSYVDQAITVLPLLLVMDVWIASRWLLVNRDPLRPVCRIMRVGVCTMVAFRTIFSTMPWRSLSGIDLRPMQITHFSAMMATGILWLIAMHADVLAAEAGHGQ